MALIDHPRFLQRVLLADAVTCAASGLAMTLGSGAIADVTRLPAGLLMAAGASLLPIAAFILLAAARAGEWPAAVWLVIVGNVGWVVGSIWLLLAGGIAPNALGAAFVIVQAVAVAILAGLEIVGLRRRPAAAAAICA